MYDETLVAKYLSMLDSPPPVGRQKEQVVQDFLEEHTELIPTPNRLNHQLHFKSIISKFPLGTEFITDYTYITKSSDTWRITFVELEVPEKELYNSSTKKVSKSSQFNAAIDQVRSWKQFLTNRRDEVDTRLRPLIQPPGMRLNPIEYHFQLIIGRSTNKNLTEARKLDFRTIQQELGITIMTYDQLVDWYRNDLLFKKNVLRLSGSAFEFKKMAAGPANMLAHLRPGELLLTSDEINELTNLGYNMAAWQRGELLVVNHKYPREEFEKIGMDLFVSGAKKT